MINDKSDEVIKELLIHLLKEYQIGLEKSIRGSDFIFGCVHCYITNVIKINPSHGVSYIDSSD